MKAKLNFLESPDIDDLQSYIPKESDNFGFLLELGIGALYKDGSDLFQVMICTPKWFNEKYKQEEIVIGLHFIFMFEYDFKLLYSRILDYIDNIKEDTWEKTALKLSYLASWEFDNYKP